jgi:hypothetical protein
MRWVDGQGKASLGNVFDCEFAVIELGHDRTIHAWVRSEVNGCSVFGHTGGIDDSSSRRAVRGDVKFGHWRNVNTGIAGGHNLQFPLSVKHQM